MPANTKVKPLTGKELLDKVKSMDKEDLKEKARACGYVTTTKKGQERVSKMQFLNALLEAQGLNLDATDGSSSRGRTPTFRVSVHKNGNLLIGAAYTKEMGLQPGDEFEIKLGNHSIKLERIEEKDEELSEN